MSDKEFKDELDENIDHLTNKNQQQESAKDKKEINLDDVFLDFTQDVPDPIVLLSQKRTDAVIFTVGNLSLILGKSKSRKTTLVVYLAAKCLGKDDEYMEVHGEKLKVVIVDTEQGLNFAYKTGRKVLRMLNKNDHENSECFKYADLRKYEREKRMDIIKEIAEKFHPDVMFIDGIVDLCADFNDQKDSERIIQALMKIAEEHRVHICCCLHFNKDGKTERGHLGAMYMQKCETTISTSISEGDKLVSIAEAHEGGCRHFPFKDFYFTMDDEGLPMIIDANQIIASMVKKPSAEERGRKYIETAIRNNGNKPMTYSDLARVICELSIDDQTVPITDRTAKTYIKTAVNSGFLVKSDGGMYSLARHDEDSQTEIEYEDPTNAIGEERDDLAF